MSSKNKVVQVNGISMAPYLTNGEFLYVNTEKLPKKGELVLVQKSNGDHIVHRYFYSNKTKGDRIKDYDEDIWGKIQIIGTIDYIKGNKNNVQMTSLSNLWLHITQANISAYNIYKYPILSKVSVFMLILIGTISRKFQGR